MLGAQPHVLIKVEAADAPEIQLPAPVPRHQQPVNRDGRRARGQAQDAVGLPFNLAGDQVRRLLLRAGGSQLGWGFQLQSPWFVGSVAVLLFVLSLSLLGVVEVGVA